MMSMESELCCGLMQCSCYTDHGRYDLSTQYAETAVYELGLYGMLEFKLCCEILLLLNMADMGRLLCVRLERIKLSTVFIQCIWTG